jgi:hypothetical protein
VAPAGFAKFNNFSIEFTHRKCIIRLKEGKNLELPDLEIFAFIASVFLSLKGWLTWYRDLASVNRLRTTVSKRLILLTAPLVCFVLILIALTKLAATTVRSDALYISFYLLVGAGFFARPEHIRAELQKLFHQLAVEQYLRGIDSKEFCRRAAHYLALHPFREGNGRAQREFIRELAVEAGYEIAWDLVTQDEMFTASVASFHGGISEAFSIILNKIIRPVR